MLSEKGSPLLRASLVALHLPTGISRTATTTDRGISS